MTFLSEGRSHGMCNKNVYVSSKSRMCNCIAEPSPNFTTTALAHGCVLKHKPGMQTAESPGFWGQTCTSSFALLPRSLLFKQTSVLQFLDHLSLPAPSNSQLLDHPTPHPQLSILQGSQCLMRLCRMAHLATLVLIAKFAFQFYLLLHGAEHHFCMATETDEFVRLAAAVTHAITTIALQPSKVSGSQSSSSESTSRVFKSLYQFSYIFSLRVSSQ